MGGRRGRREAHDEGHRLAMAAFEDQGGGQPVAGLERALEVVEHQVPAAGREHHLTAGRDDEPGLRRHPHHSGGHGRNVALRPSRPGALDREQHVAEMASDGELRNGMGQHAVLDHEARRS